MNLENIVIDAIHPRRLGRFWGAALGCEPMTDEPDLVETRLHVEDGPWLDLCFQRVERTPVEPLRLHMDLLGDAARDEVVDRLVALGAQRADVGQGDVPWVVLADPEGNPFCVMEERDVYRETGALAALPLASADPARDADFWAWLTGWVAAPGVAPRTLRHPSGRGVLLEFVPEAAPKGAVKNRMHLDVRLEPDEDCDEVAAAIVARGGEEYDAGWGDLPWRLFRDPSGNEFCVLDASADA